MVAEVDGSCEPKELGLPLINWVKGDGKKLAPNLASVKQPEEFSERDFPRYRGPHQLSESEFLNEIGWIRFASARAVVESFPSPDPQASCSKPLSVRCKRRRSRFISGPRPRREHLSTLTMFFKLSRKKLPFGIAQIGKASGMRSRRATLPSVLVSSSRWRSNFSCMPGTDEEWHQKWIDGRFAWYQSYGIRKDNIRQRKHDMR